MAPREPTASMNSSKSYSVPVTSHNTLLTLLTNPGCLWTPSNTQHPSTPSPVPCGPTLTNPRPNTDMGFIKHNPWHLPNPDPVSKYSIISCILISSNPNPVLPFMFTPPHLFP